MNNAIPTHVVTGKARMSYTSVFTPRANQNGGDPKYSTTILIPKNDIATKQRIDAAVQAAKVAGVNKCWNGTMPPLVHVPIHDGDGTRPSDGMPFGTECKGHWVFTASSKHQPAVVDLGGNPLMSAEVYSGIYAHVGIDFFPYNSNGKKGIGCSLSSLIKIEDGEPLGGGVPVSDDLSAIQQSYSQQAYPQQQAYAPTLPSPFDVNPFTGQPMAGA